MSEFDFTAEASAIEAENPGIASDIPPPEGQEPSQATDTPVEAHQEPQEPTKSPPRHVPTAALIEERRKRQAIEQQLQEIRRELESAKKPAAPPPDWDNAPAEYLRHKLDGTEAKVEVIGQALLSQQQEAVARQQLAALDQAYQSSAMAFAKANQDFVDAYNTLINSRVAELQAFGMTDPTELRAALMQEERQIAAIALQNGQDPAEVLYNLAQHRGYRPAPRQQAEAVAKGREAAKGAKSGSSGPSGMTPERLAELDGAAFEAGWKELFGE
jgi:hypothetical protein